MSSTSAPDDTQPTLRALSADVQQVTPPPSQELEKPKRRTRVSSTTKDVDTLPSNLDILWTPDSVRPDHDSAALPPQDILEEALHNLHIILHAKTQHRSIYPSPSGPPTEPTFALVCPVEGGEYIIDATVRELARRTGSDVVVLDSIQLAAGEWGAFGKAADALQLPQNPLHFPSYSQPTNPRSVATDDYDDGESPMVPPQMTLAVMAPFTSSSSSSRAVMSPTSPRRNPAPSKAKIFFDELINVSSKQLDTPDESPSSPPVKPRIIYIRDFPTLAPTSSTWYPPLLSAVRQRRQGPLSRPTSPINNPMAIIFGMTPPLTQPVPTPSNANNGSNPSPPSSSKSEEWGEDEASDKAREKRLRERLRTWERSDKAFLDQMPGLASNGEADPVSARPDIVVIGRPGAMSVIPPMLGSAMSGRSEQRRGTPPTQSNFFRTSILVPAVRARDHERSYRVKRRRDINELTMRMSIGAIGGLLGEREDAVTEADVLSKSEVDTAGQHEAGMWKDWGSRIEEWTNVRQIADRAVGSVVAVNILAGLSEKSLDQTDIPWSAVYEAWAAQKMSQAMKKNWTKLISEHGSYQEHETKTAKEDEIGELIERIKQDPESDHHEYRLLPCIVDPASMSTTFDQIHLPTHTIDSVRTVVSLPLLHPAPFQQGILKTHGMNGLLLFGPPGTGKTLIVKALAKEAGCRMMAVNPSDILDMYLGEGEKLVQAVFSLARKLSPCVVFLDEIDALFSARMNNNTGSTLAHRSVITQFMQEMDGLRSSKDHRIVVIGATNRPFDLDDAVLRRLPRRLLVDLPGEREREEILKILLRDEVVHPDVDIKVLAKKTASFSGSDLKHLCVSAALDAIKEHIEVPWDTVTRTQPSSSATSGDPGITSDADAVTLSEQTKSGLPIGDGPATPSRILSLHHFNKALKEIIPSSSESLSSLRDLRKWNEEFGEGRNTRKSQRVWGQGRFGFVQGTGPREEGKVENYDSPSEAR